MVATYCNVLSQNYNGGNRQSLFTDSVFAGNKILYFCTGHPVVFIKLEDMNNSFCFRPNTTIYFVVLLPWHVSVNWPSSGHLYKNLVSAACSATRMHLILSFVKLDWWCWSVDRNMSSRYKQNKIYRCVSLNPKRVLLPFNNTCNLYTRP
jgi:hypothetical protein